MSLGASPALPSAALAAARYWLRSGSLATAGYDDLGALPQTPGVGQVHNPPAEHGQPSLPLMDKPVHKPGDGFCEPAPRLAHRLTHNSRKGCPHSAGTAGYTLAHAPRLQAADISSFFLPGCALRVLVRGGKGTNNEKGMVECQNAVNECYGAAGR